AALCAELQRLPRAIENALKLEPAIIELAGDFIHRQHALFLGRGAHYPVALEGSLKLKEISYIHAEAYPAGELKHGPLALVTSAMPVVTVAPNDALLEKLKSNMQEVRAAACSTCWPMPTAGSRAPKASTSSACPKTMARCRRSCMWCRCSCWRITRPVRVGPTSISREIWRKVSPSNNGAANQYPMAAPPGCRSSTPPYGSPVAGSNRIASAEPHGAYALSL